jgi:hypothetical protein
MRFLGGRVGIWRFAAVLAIFGLGIAALWPVDVRELSPLGSAAVSFLHFPAFFLLTGFFCGFARLKREHAVLNAGIATVFGVAVGVLIETLQVLVGRGNDATDVGIGLLGVWTFLLIRGSRDSVFRLRTRRFFIAGACASTALAACPVCMEAAGVAMRSIRFPTLGEFNSRLELRYWIPQGGSAERYTEVSFIRSRTEPGESALRVLTGKGSWSGVSYFAGGQNWAGFNTLNFSVFNEERPFRLNMRIDDCNPESQTFGSRFDTNVWVVPGWNRYELDLIEIERGGAFRQLSIDCVNRVAFFTGANEPEREFLLANVRLVKRSRTSPGQDEIGR